VSRALFFFLVSCTQHDVVATGPCDSDDDCDGRCVSGRCVPDGGDYCEGSGPPVRVGDGPRCGGTVAETTFRFGLCTCEGYVSAHRLATDSYDSREGVSLGGRAGSVGVNGRFDSNGANAIGGALFVGDAGGVVLSPGSITTVATELRDAGDLTGGELEVLGDATVGGRIDVERLTVGGVLTQPAGAPFNAGSSTIAERREGAVSIAPPCDCSAVLDVAALVSARASENDNDRLAIDPAALDDFENATDLVLPCGRFYVGRIFGRAPLTIVATGRAALYVEGDLSLTSSLEVRVEDGAELDLFVAGNIVADDTVELGSIETASRVRLYVGGSGTLNLAAGALVAGNLYAPRAEIVTSGPLETFGSVFARRLAASGELSLHYDVAVLDAGADCPDIPPPTCTSCLDCRNQACVGGACGACRDSSDCCAPLVCWEGSCQAEPF
jgi:hypothetical protein